MQEYIDELQQKAGLTAEQARLALETIIAKVKRQVPEGFHATIDGLFAGRSGAAAFGQKNSFADQAEEKIRGFAQEAREQLSDLADKAEDIAEDVRDRTEEIVKDLSDRLSGMLGRKNEPKP